ncbi:MAG: hypothetical protein NVSMB14_12200 [Isosphaeraceae bacterium]
MRDRRARLAFVGLILALPWVLCLRSSGRTDLSSSGVSAPSGRAARSGLDFHFNFEPTPLVWWVELLVVGGLVHAARERKRLLSAREAQRFGLSASLTHLDPSIASPDSRADSVIGSVPVVTVLSVRSQTVPAA